MTVKPDSGPLAELVNRLAAFEPSDLPVLSLYIDARSDQHGKERFETVLRKALPERARTWGAHSPLRESFDRDAARVQQYLAAEVVPRANGIAIFACAAASLFEAVQIEVPFEQTRLYVGREPHLYPLARLLDEYRRYAAVLTDTNHARIFVFGLRRRVDEREVTDPKTRRSAAGGWSQMRYQRHVDNFHLHHAKEVVEVLQKVLREDEVDEVVIAGDDVALPLVRAQLPKELAARVIDILHLDVRAPEHEVLAATLAAFRRHDARTDAETVRQLLDESGGQGLGVTGARDTLAALQVGQVDELVIAAAPAAVHMDETGATDPEALAGELVRRARQTGARITFVEDAVLVQSIRGAGALLRYRLTPEQAVLPLLPPEGVEA